VSGAVSGGGSASGSRLMIAVFCARRISRWRRFEQPGRVLLATPADWPVFW